MCGRMWHPKYVHVRCVTLWVLECMSMCAYVVVYKCVGTCMQIHVCLEVVCNCGRVVCALCANACPVRHLGSSSHPQGGSHQGAIPGSPSRLLRSILQEIVFYKVIDYILHGKEDIKVIP